MNARKILSSWWTALTAEVLLVGWMSWHGDFLRAGEAWRFAMLGMAAGAAYWIAVCQFTRLPTLTPAQKARWFWAGAVVLRLAILPVLAGDDLWRYRWEGRIQLHGLNPYLLAPDSPALVGLRDAEWNRISHLNFPAIYPPLTEMAFAALAAVGTPVLGYKLLFLLVDLGVVFMLRRLLARGPGSPDAAAWYAWNPLVVYAAAGAAHFDGLMLATLLGAIWLLDRAATEDAPCSWRVSRAAWASVLLLGVSIAFKIVPLALVPVWFFALGWRRAALTLPIALAVSPLLAMVYGFPRAPVFSALGHFANDFRVNDAFWWIVDALRGGHSPATGNALYQAIAGCIGGALALWFRRDWRRGMLWVMGATLVLSPVLHAWYVVWILPLAVWREPFARPWFVLSISVFAYFLLWEVNHESYRPWAEPVWLRLLIYLPPLIALLAGRFRGRAGSPSQSSFP